jgi:hypothetical protein
MSETKPPAPSRDPLAISQSLSEPMARPSSIPALAGLGADGKLRIRGRSPRGRLSADLPRSNLGHREWCLGNSAGQSE